MQHVKLSGTDLRCPSRRTAMSCSVKAFPRQCLSARRRTGWMRTRQVTLTSAFDLPILVRARCATSASRWCFRHGGNGCATVCARIGAGSNAAHYPLSRWLLGRRGGRPVLRGSFVASCRRRPRGTAGACTVSEADVGFATAALTGRYGTAVLNAGPARMVRLRGAASSAVPVPMAGSWTHADSVAAVCTGLRGRLAESATAAPTAG
mmetsp:Transcript_54219/g.117198  ORF Transcript_54219/g.117198 Transcript_54219/m.117198 type:complete len:207 (+) Transcript_54219:56-676(+)